jgi:hypothetical protein
LSAEALVPITITPGWDGTTNFVGPGVQIGLTSSFIGPLPVGSQWNVQLWSSTSPEAQIFIQQIDAKQTNSILYHYLVEAGQSYTAYSQMPKEGDNVSIKAYLQEPTGTVDQGQITAKWTNSQLGVQNFLQAQGQAGGFTETDRALLTTTEQNTTTMDTNWQQYESVTLPSLQDVLNNIVAAVHATIGAGTSSQDVPLSTLFSWKPWDYLAPRDLSGGTTCVALDVDISLRAYYGIGVYIDSYPDTWEFRTPDGAWGFHDLAVLTFVRGGSIIQRHGIHTVTHEVSPVPGSLTPTVVELPISLQPADYHIRVDWAEGVCGHVLGYVIP